MGRCQKDGRDSDYRAGRAGARRETVGLPEAFQLLPHCVSSLPAFPYAGKNQKDQAHLPTQLQNGLLLGWAQEGIQLGQGWDSGPGRGSLLDRNAMLTCGWLSSMK